MQQDCENSRGAAMHVVSSRLALRYANMDEQRVADEALDQPF
jgi:hypothetical protein